MSRKCHEAGQGRCGWVSHDRGCKDMMGVAAVISTERLGTTGFDAVGGGGWKALCWSGCWCCIPSAICPDPLPLESLAVGERGDDGIRREDFREAKKKQTPESGDRHGGILSAALPSSSAGPARPGFMLVVPPFSWTHRRNSDSSKSCWRCEDQLQKFFLT